jgi:hypothetical protein
MPRYGAIFNGIRLSDAGDRTGWLGMSDSNWRIRPRAIRLQFCDNLARVGATRRRRFFACGVLVPILQL